MKHTLDLRGNAVDSLNEGLRKYIAGRDGDIRAYKFAVLHFAHFLELLMKCAVAEQHPLLIYEKPSARPLTRSNTIGIWPALQILENVGISVDKQLRSDLEWLKTLRNNIEHYAFDMDVKEVRSSLGRLLRASDAFVSSAKLASLRPDIAQDCAAVFDELLDEYLETLGNARADARRGAGEGDVTYCSFCGEQDTVFLDRDVFLCCLCEEREEIHECVICSQPNRDSEMTVWNDEHETLDYACVSCEERIFSTR